MYQPLDLNGRGVVVTGGNGGIGYGMARALLAAGANVAIWGSNAEKTGSARDALAEECGMVRAMGFAGKAAIHPAQIAAINAAFEPTCDERMLAQRILAAAPDGVGVLDGKMIDIAMVRWARRIA